MAEHSVSVGEVEQARARIGGRIRRTPLVYKQALSDRVGVPVHLKYEHMQRTGSFKIRGALNLIAQLDSSDLAAGVVAASAGNHAQGVAVAAAEFGTEATIFMPAAAALSKIEATKGYGARVELIEGHLGAVLEHAQRHAESTGATLVHPYDDARIIAGQGTLALEVLEHLGEVGTIVVPIGGGGLFAGVASVMRERCPDCRIVGVQSAACQTVAVSLAAGSPQPAEPTSTMAEGIAVKQLGELTFPAVRDYLDELIIVDEEQISRAIVWSIERAKQVIEGSAATTLAALLDPQTKPVGPTVCVLSGGNIDTTLLMTLLRHGLTAAGRYVSISTTVSDRPGELSAVLAVLAAEQVNILEIDHRREGFDIPVGATRIDLLLQVRNREHITDVLTALESAGYCSHTL